MAKDDMVTVDEFRTEQTKLENDRAGLNERLQALNAEREKCIQQLTMIAGALQTVNHFIAKIDPALYTWNNFLHLNHRISFFYI